MTTSSLLIIKISCIVACVSFIVNALIIRATKKYEILLDKEDTQKPQKFHKGDIPRAGGIGIIIGLVVAICLGVHYGCLDLHHREMATRILENRGYMLLLIPLGVVFLSGILEDFHNSLSPRIRLCLQAVGACVSVVLFDSIVTNIGFELPYTLSIIFSIFAMTGVINAINIIDGFNGLAGGFCIMVFISIACVAYIVGDNNIFYLSIMCIAATCGFILLNFPKGLIFLGDGGAYLLGFILSYLLVKITKESGVSSYYGLCVMIYPIFEVLFSVYRKKFIRNISAMQPDNVHFHMLIHRCIMHSNPKTSVFIWCFNVPFVFLPIFFFGNIFVLLALIACFVSMYCFMYFRIIRFKGLR